MIYDLVIVGGGAAGIKCAVEAKKQRIDNILLIEYEKFLGGTLTNIIESDDNFGENGLTGVELADDLTKELIHSNVEFLTNTRVMSIEKDKSLLIINPEKGLERIRTKSLIIAAGGRERPRGILNFTSKRSAGIYSAGTVRRFIVREGYLPGKNIVIYGSDLTGLYLSKLAMIEGAESVTIVDQSKEIKYIPDELSEFFKIHGVKIENGYSIVDINGENRIESITIESNTNGMQKERRVINCDALVLAVGLSSQKGLVKKFKRDQEESGIFLVGNAKYVSFDIKHIFNDAMETVNKVKDYLEK